MIGKAHSTGPAKLADLSGALATLTPTQHQLIRDIAGNDLLTTLDPSFPES